ncbi:MAG: type II toxin-antitoxin system HicA family toxin [Chloroflexota bacterium]
MSRLNNVSARECIRALERAGFIFKRQNGSHIILGKAGRRVSVPNHNPIKVGTLRNIIDQAGLTVDEFLELL